jgi:hypothetical protein
MTPGAQLKAENCRLINVKDSAVPSGQGTPVVPTFTCWKRLNSSH